MRSPYGQESPETPETEQEAVEPDDMEEAVDEVDEPAVDDSGGLEVTGESGGPDQEPPMDGAAEYVEYETDKLREPDDLYRSPTPIISSVVSEIVSMEGRIHVEEVIRRIRESCGLRRAGRRVRSIINSAIEMAENNGNIKRNGEFLSSQTQCLLRFEGEVEGSTSPSYPPWRSRRR
ncbi:unknown [Methanothermobacter thermautotrophicus str. Delta H]|uniref:DUF3320 domain-containing protein n=1 Tax=Methanothermobacter thermautotrophicus (strain ATCC 29096 / DSM 1053 / JCM 10044 / NBRC 100330 / Delta H) TaxID=187420 RepID=O26586_METTH|nr:DUF3320 domain-containing protein [Methanothermobacter thermautotrophicus]AAB84992.1 unknown [Methanothermobacter thermautotrophicus str. Delta H]